MVNTTAGRLNNTMNPIQLGKPLGFSGVTSRISELEQLLNLNVNNEVTSSPPSSNSAGVNSGSFSSMLNGASEMPSMLSGSIGTSSNGLVAPASPFSNGIGISSSPSGDLKKMISDIAIQNGLDPKLLDSLVKQESNYNPLSRSSAGAMGLTQLMPQTASQLGVTQPFDVAQNLSGGAKYLKAMIHQFGSIPLALAAYNAGPHAVLKYGGIPPFNETQNYVKNIMANYGKTENNIP